jgi:hypothetical protein
MEGAYKSHPISYYAWYDFVALRLAVLTYAKSTLRVLASRASSYPRS